jgi:hypothetical protein
MPEAQDETPAAVASFGPSEPELRQMMEFLERMSEAAL